MKAGELNEELMIQTEETISSDEHGTPKQAWKDRDWVYCKIESLGGSEYERATGQVFVGGYRIKLRLQGAEWITTKMRGRWVTGSGQILEFTSLQPNPRKDELIVMASEVGGSL